MVILALVWMLFPMGCQAATYVKVYFREFDGSKGQDKCMNKLTVKVKKGKEIVLPALPALEGYNSLGWSKAKKSVNPDYQAGDSLTVSKSVILYAVRAEKAKVTVTFMDTLTGATYEELTTQTYEGTKIVLPQVPSSEGYQSLGWTTKKGKSSPLYQAGSKKKIKKNLVLYSVVEKTSNRYTVSFFDEKGEAGEIYEELKTTAEEGSSIVLPEVEEQKGYTFLGWSTKKEQTDHPDYLAGASMIVREEQNLYAVMYPTSLEPECESLATGWQKLYRKVIFVGDSRTHRMEEALFAEYGNSPNLVEVSFICEEGQGLNWFKQEGKDALLKSLGYAVRPAAIIFNLGINDLYNASNYITYLTEIKAELEAKNVQLFFMSVNPVNNPMLEKSGRSESGLYRTAARVLAFNEMMKKKLCSKEGGFTYLDTYQFLIQSGFTFDSGKDGIDSGEDDGLHYGGKTYRRIFNQVITLLMG